MLHALDPLMDRASRWIFQPLYRARVADRSHEHLARVRRVAALPPRELRAHQLERLRAVLGAALETPWYARTLREAGVRDPRDVTLESLAQLPLVTKKDLREHNQDFDNPRFGPADVVRAATGGTTEAPLAIRIDRQGYQMRWAATAHFDQALGFTPGEKRAYLWGAPQDYVGNDTPRQRLKRLLVSRDLFLPSSPLDDALLDAHVETLRRFRPRHLQAYPTPLGILAGRLLEKGVFLPLKTVSCCSEPLLPDTRALIEDAFRQKVFNWYGAREAGRIATECARHDGMHVNAFGLLVEVLPLPGGDLGEVVLTDLFNEATPLVRYKIGDLGRLDATPCPCGLAAPRLFDVAGRIFDCFVNAKGQWIAGIAFNNRFVRDNSAVQKIQILQKGYDEFEILVVPGRGFGPDTLDELGRRLDEFMLQRNRVTCTLVEDIPLAASGKSVMCRRLFTPEHREVPCAS